MFNSPSSSKSLSETGIECPLKSPTSVSDVLSVVVPSPRVPYSFRPQQYIEESSIVAHPCALPTPIWVTVLPAGKETGTGVELDVVEPSPNCPYVFSPQQ